MLNKDYKEMLQCLLEENVDFLLVGAHALAAPGYPRATKAMDIWVWTNPENASRLMQALARFGAPVDQVSESDFCQEGIVYQIGTSPPRSTVCPSIRPTKNASPFDIEGLNVPVISKTDLVTNKTASGRPQDLVDASLLGGKDGR